MREAPKDRISDLPDSLLHHIHSFLKIRDGARTRVLSKRWNYIWTTVPILKFKKERDNSFSNSTSSETGKFMNFVDATLHRRNSSNIDKFLLNWDVELNESRVHLWISTAIQCNVKKLSLSLQQKHPLFIPLSLFTCESLISLKLWTHPNVRFPKFISFPKLKRLKIVQFKFSDDCWNEELFSNSTVLEELILQDCKYRMKNFCISIPTLKLLEIGRGFETDDGLRDCIFEIDAPRLATFSYSGNLAKEFVLSSFQVLVEATLDLNCGGNNDAEVIQIRRNLAHVKCLTVDDLTLQAICSAYDRLNNLLQFHDVKALNISDVLTDTKGLIALLKASPNLESLVLYEYISDGEEDIDEDDIEEEDSDEEDSDEDSSDDTERNRDDDNSAESIEAGNSLNNEDGADISNGSNCEGSDEGGNNYDSEDNSSAPNIVPNGCLFLHLKSVCFRQFLGNPREIWWVKLILRNAEALQTMTISYYDDFVLRYDNAKSEKELMVEIPSFPRASPGCVFKFYSWDWKSVIILSKENEVGETDFEVTKSLTTDGDLLL